MTFTLPYERKGFSQHGETGIIEILLQGIHTPRKNFLEIGLGVGFENMSYDLLEKGYNGIGVDPRPWNETWTRRYPELLTKIQSFVNPQNVVQMLTEHGLEKEIDFFSLDIDSYDYVVAEALINWGFRPAVVCVEINRYFANDVVASFPYVEIPIKKVYKRKYFGGVSLKKWKNFWQANNYTFFTLNHNDVNAFFYDSSQCTVDSTLPVIENVRSVVNDEEIKNAIMNDYIFSSFIDEIYK
jgi:hypothetical protein